MTNWKSIGGQNNFALSSFLSYLGIILGFLALLLLVFPSSVYASELPTEQEFAVENAETELLAFEDSEVSEPNELLEELSEASESSSSGLENEELENNLDSFFLPTITGTIVYHSYSTYEARDSRLYLYNFSTDTLTCLSDLLDDYGIYNAMNAHFSPVAPLVTFCAFNVATDCEQWDIYTYNLETQELNCLTADNDLRNEDPKFSPDGSKIVFKRGYWNHEYDCMAFDIAEYDLAAGTTVLLTNDLEEQSMPYYSGDGRYIYFAEGVGSNSQIMRLDRENDYQKELVYNEEDICSYYPIMKGQNCYFTRWQSIDNFSDGLMLYTDANGHSQPLGFCQPYDNYSDACPVNDNYLICSSTETGGGNSFDLILADLVNNITYSLNLYNSGVNTSLPQLGASYSPIF